MLDLTLDVLQEYLQKNQIDVQLQPETQQLYIVFKIDKIEYPLFIRIYEGGDLLQLLIFLPYDLKKSLVGDTARLLHLLNKEIDIPGFGIDETTGVIFYRAVIPCFDKKIDEGLLSSYLNSIQTICQTFTPVIGSVSTGAASFEKVLKTVQEAGPSK